MCIGPPSACGRYSISDAPSVSASNACPNQRARLTPSFSSSQGSSSKKFRRRMRSSAAIGHVSVASSRCLGWWNCRAHHAVVLALGPVVAEAGLLVEAARDVVEELGRDLLALRVLRIALDHASAGLRDHVDGAAERRARDALP